MEVKGGVNFKFERSASFLKSVEKARAKAAKGDKSFTRSELGEIIVIDGAVISIIKGLRSDDNYAINEDTMERVTVSYATVKALKSALLKLI